ncbi:MAG TPA: ribose-phosphate diphosphokinase [Chromatiales bacterium]|nr:ribose-phosphate diphosphokinase [Chromatiales bacterium]
MTAKHLSADQSAQRIGQSFGPQPWVLAFPEARALAGRIASRLALPLEAVSVHRFPDGERRVRLPAALPPEIALVQRLDDPDARLVALMLAAETARELGAHRIVLVAPYLCYMRQDRAFQPGEAVSQRIVGRFLARLCDALVTVDPHLHRTRRLEEAVPVPEAASVSAAPLLARHVAAARPGALLLAPDAEAAAWVRAGAEAAGLEWATARKERRGDREVEVALDDPARCRGRCVCLLDDVASTGATLAAAARAARAAGAAEVCAAVTHALFVGDAIGRLRAAGVTEIWSADTVPHPTNAVSVAAPLAAAVAGLLRLEDA